MKIEFGVPVHVGNYVIKKYNRSLGRKELAELRRISGIPADVAKSLERGRLPYIKVSTASGSWGVEFVIGTSMYEALDNLNVVFDDEGRRQLCGVEARNAEAMFVGMLADTTTVGDFEYQVAKQKLLHEYLDRASKARNAKADEGKTEEQKAKMNAFKDADPKSQVIEDVCEYCGGIYVVGTVINCPHCAAPLKPHNQYQNN